MDLRILTEPHQGAAYDELLRVAKAAENAGYDAFFRSDHYLKMGDVSGWPGPTDAWITLAGIARETTTIRLGTLVTAATFRHPSVLAISVAQVDQMSAGRVEFGLGSGYFAPEHRTYGIPLPDVGERFDRYAEQLEIVTGLWETPPEKEFDFVGEHYEILAAPGLPRPVQRPRPPVIVGGTGRRRTPALAARFADEFNVIFTDADTAAGRFGRVDDEARRAGRDPTRIVRSAALLVAAGRTRADIRRRVATIVEKFPPLAPLVGQPSVNLFGTPSEVVDAIGRYRETTGIGRLYLEMLDLADLDQLELIASEVKPQLS